MNRSVVRTWGVGLLWLVLATVAPAHATTAACPAILDRSVPTLLDERPESLCQFAGQVVLVVNTASYCGFTPQYEGLERLSRELRPRGLAVIGFPSNDFGGQEPGNAREIREFCSATYGVRFPLFAKTVVRGAKAHPFYRDLAQATGESPGWNFHKYLIDRRGRVVASIASDVKPDDPALRQRIEALLAAPRP